MSTAIAHYKAIVIFEPFYPKKLNEAEESIDHDACEEHPIMRRPLITLLDKSKIVVRNAPGVGGGHIL